MFCKRCGKEVSNDASFCEYCGEKLKGNSFESTVNDIASKVDDFSKKVDGQVESAINNVKSDLNENVKSGEKQKLTTDRSIVAYVLLTIITCGIYGYYFIYNLAKEINVACEGDDERTPGLASYIIFSFLTCGFYSLYWEYKIANRIAANGSRYGLHIEENGSSVLLWRIFGCFICMLGTFVGTNILITNANRICAAYNQKYNL